MQESEIHGECVSCADARQLMCAWRFVDLTACDSDGERSELRGRPHDSQALANTCVIESQSNGSAIQLMNLDKKAPLL